MNRVEIVRVSGYTGIMTIEGLSGNAIDFRVDSDTMLCIRVNAILIFLLCEGIIRWLLYDCMSISVSRITGKVVDYFR